MENVTAFKYLGRILMAGDDDWTDVDSNLKKVRKSLVWMLRILSREGVDLKVLGHFFKALMQAVLRFGAQTRVLTPRMERTLISFQHRFARRLTRRQPRWQGEGSWKYSPLATAMAE